MELDRRLEVLRTPGVRSLVESCGRACELPDAEIDLLQRVCAAQPQGVVRPHPYLKEGEKARVCQGPFAGTEGIFLRAKNRNRVVISVELLQRSVAVEVCEADVEPLTKMQQFVMVPAEV
jgi:transcription antitermination factor NusG